MAYKVPDKPLSDFTAEEREEFIAELKANSTPEAWEATVQFFDMVKGVRDWMQTDKVQQDIQAIKYALQVLREGLPLLQEEIET